MFPPPLPVPSTCCFPAYAHESSHPPLPRTDTKVREAELQPGNIKPSIEDAAQTQRRVPSQTLWIQEDFLKGVLPKALGERPFQGETACAKALRQQKAW